MDHAVAVRTDSCEFLDRFLNEFGGGIELYYLHPCRIIITHLVSFQLILKVSLFPLSSPAWVWRKTTKRIQGHPPPLRLRGC